MLSEALARHPGVFSKLYISLVKAGEVSGKLSETLEELAKYLESVEDTQRKVKSALYYPVFIIIFLAVVLLVTFTFLIPQFESIYISLNAELPFYTRLFIAISLWFRGNFFLITGVAIISILSVWIITRKLSNRVVRRY